MPRNSSGDYSAPSGSTATTKTTISSSSHNSLVNDLASALTGSLARDGSGGMLADMAMGDHNITGLATPTADAHAATKKYVDDSAASITAIPTGVVVPFAGDTAPSGWLLCFGQAVSRDTYSTLFTLLSTTYGTGDGTTTFNLPDLRGRVVAGQDDMGGSAANRLTSNGSGVDGTTLGASGGEETHTLTETELAEHDHTLTMDAVPDHDHGTPLQQYFVRPGSGGQSFVDLGSGINTNAAGGHTPTGTVGNAGSGTAHNNVQPTIVLNYIIKI